MAISWRCGIGREATNHHHQVQFSSTNWNIASWRSRSVADGVEALEAGLMGWTILPHHSALKQLANLLGFALEHCGLVSNTNLL